ncbi:MAG: riboflavin biosynthesis protein RibF [Bacteroides sp.]|nr:riboflavin biosynthesis protein RibF [Bacteroides sp.]MBD5372280.1 riboflavin biosynthesis protein RibF [Bacteroides sp.]
MHKRAAVIGVFDGVHRGHQFLLEQLKTEAERRDYQPVALTFDRHPLELVNPGAVPARICSLQERLELLRRAEVEPIVLEFTPELRAMSAREFCAFIRTLGVDLLLMGFNNRIGSDRKRGTELIDEPIEIIVARELPEGGVSSSAVRKSVGQGDMELAAKLLGRPFVIEGKVVTGRQIGRTIGFPTANIQPSEANALMPPIGVYAGEVDGRPAVINIGRRPTVNNGNDVTIEVHILDFQGDLYGRHLRVEFLRRLRPEMKFSGFDELKAQIQKDIDNARGK